MCLIDPALQLRNSSQARELELELENFIFKFRYSQKPNNYSLLSY